MLTSTSSNVPAMWPDSRPFQIAGNAWMLVRSLIEPCSRLISSSAVFSVIWPHHFAASCNPSRTRRSRSSCKNCSGGMKKGYTCNTPPRITHRMRPQDAHDNVPTEPGEVVGADDRVTAALVHQAELRLVFDQVTRPFVILQRPLHVAYQAGAEKPRCPATTSTSRHRASIRFWSKQPSGRYTCVQLQSSS